MKKIIFMLGAVLTFGVASAQTETVTTQKNKTETTVIKQEKEKDRKTAGEVQPAVVTPAQQGGKKEMLLQDEAVPKDHVKVTPKAATVKDTVATKKVTKTKKS